MAEYCKECADNFGMVSEPGTDICEGCGITFINKSPYWKLLLLVGFLILLQIVISLLN